MFDADLAKPGSDEERLLSRLDPAALPRHVAIIMDGNGRWAKARHLPRAMGHRAGAKSVREVVETAARLKLPLVTLYAFSRENWKRPPTEVRTLMTLLREFLAKELDELVRSNVRLSVIGRMGDLQPAVRDEIAQALDATADNTGLELCVALSYGGRTEIVDACRALVREGIPADEIDEERFERHLYTAGRPAPDLLIRTSGELRVSNFLLWQIAYAEIWVTSTLWPDFTRKHFFEALLDYQSRDRRYGGIDHVPGGNTAPVARG